MNLPKARTAEIVTQDLGKELLVYDLLTNKAYNLNATSRAVFNSCDGKTSFSDLKRQYNFTDDLIHFAINELKNCNLIESETVNHFSGLSRREVIRRVGVASLVALPIISTMVAPQAAHAASGARLANGQFCSDNTQCTSNRCGQSGFGPSCCSSNTFGTCTFSSDCCTGVACTNNVCCQGSGRSCDTRSPNECCSGLTCVAPNGQTNGSCQ